MGVNVGESEVGVPLVFPAFIGSGPSREVMPGLDNLTSGVLRITGEPDIALSVTDAAGGVLVAVVDGSDIPSSAQAQVILTFADGTVRESQHFSVTQTATIPVTP